MCIITNTLQFKGNSLSNFKYVSMSTTAKLGLILNRKLLTVEWPMYLIDKACNIFTLFYKQFPVYNITWCDKSKIV